MLKLGVRKLVVNQCCARLDMSIPDPIKFNHENKLWTPLASYDLAVTISLPKAKSPTTYSVLVSDAMRAKLSHDPTDKNLTLFNLPFFNPKNYYSKVD